MKERCRCGNRVPIGELHDGLCLACVREAKEKRAAAEEERHLAELQARYSLFTPFPPHGE